MPLLEPNYEYFLEANLSKYSGQWVTLYNNEVVSHGNNLKEVVKEAMSKCGGNKFLLVKVPSGETMIF